MCLLALAVAGLRAEDFLGRLDEVLTISNANGSARARLSGTLDLEYYHVDQPVSGLIDTTLHESDFAGPGY